MFGSESLIKDLRNGLDSSEVRVVRAPCMGLCDKAPACEVGHRHVTHANLQVVEKVVKEKIFIQRKLLASPSRNIFLMEDTKFFRNVMKEKLSIDFIINELNQSGLKGMGGAGFPSGQKWKFVRLEKSPRLMTINGDEGEPGTFKDKLYLEQNIHQFFEGMLIAAWAVEAKDVYLYER